jgi:hypothetical protein
MRAVSLGMSHASARILLWASLSLALVACDTRPTQSTPKPRGAELGGPVPATAPPPSAPEPVHSVSKPPAAPTPTAKPEAPKQDEPKRDLPAELLQQMGSAVGCLATRPSDTAPRSIEISLTALIGVTGRVSRGEARSSVLGAGELACVRARIEAASFALPLDPPPPLTIQATLRFDQASQPARPGQPAAPTPAAPRSY